MSQYQKTQPNTALAPMDHDIAKGISCIIPKGKPFRVAAKSPALILRQEFNRKPLDPTTGPVRNNLGKVQYHRAHVMKNFGAGRLLWPAAHDPAPLPMDVPMRCADVLKENEEFQTRAFQLAQESL